MGFHLSGDSPQPFGSLSAVYYAFNYGWAGVDLFFVLSGFLITSILLNTKDSPNYFSSFYARRVLRIFPLYFLAVALFFYLELPLLERHYGVISSVRSEQFWYWTYLSNWHNPLDRPIAALNHFWSLAIEEQFYLAWPFAIWICTRKSGHRSVVWLCLGSILIANIIRAICELRGVYWEVLHRNTFMRFDALALGGLLAVAATNPEWSAKLRRWGPLVAAVALLGFAASEFAGKDRGTFFYTIRYGLPPLVLGFLVFYCFSATGSESVLPRLFRSRFMRSIGKYSYSMYVFHLVAVRYLIVPFVQRGMRLGLSLPVALVLAMVISGIGVYLFAVFTWHAFESHFLKLKTRFSYEIQPSPPLAASAAPSR